MTGFAAGPDLMVAEWVNFEAPKGHEWLFFVLFVVVVGGPFVIERFRLPGSSACSSVGC